MQKVKSKQDIREEVAQAVTAYLSQGGQIQQIHMGVSGREDNAPPQYSSPFSTTERVGRTPVNDTIQAIEQRKYQQKEKTKKPDKPQRKMLYDDFGDPIRVIWE